MQQRLRRFSFAHLVLNKHILAENQEADCQRFFLLSDATSRLLFQAGYSGEDVESMVYKLLVVHIQPISLFLNVMLLVYVAIIFNQSIATFRHN
jgi:hypothetical protein